MLILYLQVRNKKIANEKFKITDSKKKFLFYSKNIYFFFSKNRLNKILLMKKEGISRKKIISYIRSLDIFGQQVNLVVKEKDTYTSSIGSVATLAIIVFTSYSFITMTLDILERKNPNIVSTTRKNIDFEVNII